MKKINFSINKKPFLFSLIPAGFSLLLLLFTWWKIPVLLILGWTLCMLWIWIGYRSHQLIHHYGKALILVNWMGFLCFLFALIYYSGYATHMLWYADLYFPINDELIFQYFIPKYIAGDIFASLFPSSFLTGAFCPYLGYGNRILMVITTNTITALALFSIGYISSAAKDVLHRKKSNTP